MDTTLSAIPLDAADDDSTHDGTPPDTPPDTPLGLRRRFNLDALPDPLLPLQQQPDTPRRFRINRGWLVALAAAALFLVIAPAAAPLGYRSVVLFRGARHPLLITAACEQTLRALSTADDGGEGNCVIRATEKCLLPTLASAVADAYARSPGLAVELLLNVTTAFRAFPDEGRRSCALRDAHALSARLVEAACFNFASVAPPAHLSCQCERHSTCWKDDGSCESQRQLTRPCREPATMSCDIVADAVRDVQAGISPALSLLVLSVGWAGSVELAAAFARIGRELLTDTHFGALAASSPQWCVTHPAVAMVAASVRTSTWGEITRTDEHDTTGTIEMATACARFPDELADALGYAARGVFEVVARTALDRLSAPPLAHTTVALGAVTSAAACAPHSKRFDLPQLYKKHYARDERGCGGDAVYALEALMRGWATATAAATPTTTTTTGSVVGAPRSRAAVESLVTAALGTIAASDSPAAVRAVAILSSNMQHTETTTNAAGSEGGGATANIGTLASLPRSSTRINYLTRDALIHVATVGHVPAASLAAMEALVRDEGRAIVLPALIRSYAHAYGPADVVFRTLQATASVCDSDVVSHNATIELLAYLAAAAAAGALSPVAAYHVTLLAATFSPGSSRAQHGQQLQQGRPLQQTDQSQSQQLGGPAAAVLPDAFVDILVPIARSSYPVSAIVRPHYHVSVDAVDALVGGWPTHSLTLPLLVEVARSGLTPAAPAAIRALVRNLSHTDGTIAALASIGLGSQWEISEQGMWPHRCWTSGTLGLLMPNRTAAEHAAAADRRGMNAERELGAPLNHCRAVVARAAVDALACAHRPQPPRLQGTPAEPSTEASTLAALSDVALHGTTPSAAAAALLHVLTRSIDPLPFLLRVVKANSSSVAYNRNTADGSTTANGSSAAYNRIAATGSSSSAAQCVAMRVLAAGRHWDRDASFDALAAVARAGIGSSWAAVRALVAGCEWSADRHARLFDVLSDVVRDGHSHAACEAVDAMVHAFGNEIRTLEVLSGRIRTEAMPPSRRTTGGGAWAVEVNDSVRPPSSTAAAAAASASDPDPEYFFDSASPAFGAVKRHCGESGGCMFGALYNSKQAYFSVGMYALANLEYGWNSTEELEGLLSEIEGSLPPPPLPSISDGYRVVPIASRSHSAEWREAIAHARRVREMRLWKRAVVGRAPDDYKCGDGGSSSSGGGGGSPAASVAAAAALVTKPFLCASVAWDITGSIPHYFEPPKGIYRMISGGRGSIPKFFEAELWGLTPRVCGSCVGWHLWEEWELEGH